MKLSKYLFAIALLFPSLGSANCYSCNNFYVTADYLYWKAYINNLEYAISGINTPTAPGETIDLDWKWDSGFKAGVGYLFLESGWDFYLNYTRFTTKAKGESLPGETAIYATYPNPFLLQLEFASSHFELQYNTLDFEIKNGFRPNPSLLITPSFGFRGAWAQDKDDIVYLSTAFGVENVSMRERFRGIGPRIGLKALFNFCGQFSLFGEGDFAVLWGNHTTHFFSTAAGIIAADTKQHYSALKYLTDVKVGVEWEHLFCHSRLTLQLAWENRLWLDYNHYFRFMETFVVSYVPNASPLSLYGLTFGAKYSF